MTQRVPTNVICGAIFGLDSDRKLKADEDQPE